MSEESKMLLRLQFEAETDIEVVSHPGDWKKYAQWLEKLTIAKLNEEIVRENNSLYDIVYKVMKMLQEEIVKV